MGSGVCMGNAHELIEKFGNDLIKKYTRLLGVSEWDIDFKDCENLDGVNVVVKFNENLTLTWPIFQGEDCEIRGYWIDENLKYENLPKKVKIWLDEEDY